jgi:hypothetical protein
MKMSVVHAAVKEMADVRFWSGDTKSVENRYPIAGPKRARKMAIKLDKR